MSSNVETDDDEWIDICLNPSLDLVEDIDLEMILQAEQVTRLLLNTYAWATNEEVSETVPSLSNIIIESMNCTNGEGKQPGISDTVASSLSQLYQAINGAVEIVRGGPNLYDLNNQFSYQFRLATGNGCFGELDALRRKEEECIERLQKSGVGIKEKQKLNQLSMIR
ncbi:hypothetical protein HJC23_004146 [Cyclotella cryptica]|uniref:Uncharacterized protein n=1 Tax=Cyclotella cryptica TaxID=29204 RepID=A0ABD3PH93_9STRA